MKRALMYASVASMIKQFNMPNIKLLQSLGYEVDVACNFEFGSTISEDKIKKLQLELKKMNVCYYHIPIPRKVNDYKHLRISYRMTKKILNENQYDLVHCHSPIGGLISRIANKNCSNYTKTNMIYTAHGFHFFKGNKPIKNFIYKNIEKYAAKYTNVLITMNNEDFNAAKKFRMRKNGKVELIPGIGIDLNRISSIGENRELLLDELSLSSETKLLLSVGELSVRKNHKIIIESLPFLSDNIHYLICGKGSGENELKELSIKNKVENRVHFLGFRSNVIEIMKSSDIFVFPSLQEGLPVSLMEAMACGLYCIASNIRGNSDLIVSESSGLLVNKNEVSEYVEKIEIGFIKQNNHPLANMCDNDISIVNAKMEQIYK